MALSACQANVIPVSCAFLLLISTPVHIYPYLSIQATLPTAQGSSNTVVHILRIFLARFHNKANYFHTFVTMPTCRTCGGEGQVTRRCTHCSGTGFSGSHTMGCRRCGGNDDDCSACNGTGRVTLRIPCGRCSGRGTLGTVTCGGCDGYGDTAAYGSSDSSRGWA